MKKDPRLTQFRLLFQFLAISRLGSISAAARELGVTQPALSRSVKQLEDTLNVRLLDRRAKGVVLTAEGLILARRVKLMDIEYQHALSEISDHHQGIKGRLRLAAGPSWIVHFLPNILADFSDRYPDVLVTLTHGPFSTQLDALLNGDCDAICGTLDFPDHPEIHKEHVFDARYTVYARAGHPLTLHHASPDDLNSYPWILLADDPISSSWVGSYFAAHRLEPPRIAIETTTLGCISLLRQSDCLTIFEAKAESSMQAFGLQRIEHDGTFWNFPAGVARRRSARASAAYRAFREMIRSHLESPHQ